MAAAACVRVSVGVFAHVVPLMGRAHPLSPRFCLLIPDCGFTVAGVTYGLANTGYNWIPSWKCVPGRSLWSLNPATFFFLFFFLFGLHLWAELPRLLSLMKRAVLGGIRG